MREQGVFGPTKPQSVADSRILLSSGISSQTKPLTTEQITEGMRILGDRFDLFQQLAEALKKS